jgi:iron complex transport system substrate-binding protein
MKRRSFCRIAACFLGISACRHLEREDGSGADERDAPVLPRAARRIASLSPSTTETLFAVGAGDRVVARSRFCDFPPEAHRLPVVGGYVDVSLEAVLAMRPDLVVGGRGPGREALAARLHAFGIPTFFPAEDSIEDVLTMIVQLASAAGVGERGAWLERRVRARLDAVTRAASVLPHPSALLIVGVNPIVAIAPRSFIGELLGRAGARNVVSSSVGYPTLGVEELVALDPDLVIDAATIPSHGSDAVAPEAPGFREMRAIRAGHLVLLDDVSVLRPGPRVGDALASLARLIHPGFVPPDPDAATQ